MGYQFSRTLTINHTKCGASDSNNFPVLFSGTYAYLATVANGGFVTNANGYDIIFTSDAAGNTKLDHEIETYTAASGLVNFSVRVPTVTHTTDTVIYLWYGNSAITTSQENVTGVWDANFKAVYHLGNGSTLSVADSTGANNGTNSGATATTSGKIGGAANFNGTSQGIDLNANVGSYVLANSFTIEAWINAALDSVNRVIYGNEWALAGYHIRVTTANKIRFGLVTDGANYNSMDSNALSAGLHHVVGVWGGSGTPKIYIDGSEQSITGATLGTVTTITTTAHTWIGRTPEAGNENYFKTIIDEVRSSNVARSADWITTEYNNQNSPSTFYTVGEIINPANLRITRQAVSRAALR